MDSFLFNPSILGEWNWGSLKNPSPNAFPHLLSSTNHRFQNAFTFPYLSPSFHFSLLPKKLLEFESCYRSVQIHFGCCMLICSRSICYNIMFMGVYVYNDTITVSLPPSFFHWLQSSAAEIWKGQCRFHSGLSKTKGRSTGSVQCASEGYATASASKSWKGSSSSRKSRTYKTSWAPTHTSWGYGVNFT